MLDPPRTTYILKGKTRYTTESKPYILYTPSDSLLKLSDKESEPDNYATILQELHKRQLSINNIVRIQSSVSSSGVLKV